MGNKEYLITDMLQKYQGSPDLNDLWQTFHHDLSEYGVTSIYYGWTHSLNLVEEVGIADAVWHMTSHSKEYNDHFGERFTINNDLSAIHCMSKIDPFIWHNRQQWGEPTEQQLKFMLDSFQFNMGVGVSLPVRFNQFGVGGIGLNFADSTEKEFNKIWASYRDEISTIGFVYDELARGNHMQEICPLSPREIEVLTWLTLGKNIKMIAHKIGNSTSTVDKQIRSARRKLNARNNEQAVVKALILGLIEP